MLKRYLTALLFSLFLATPARAATETGVEQKAKPATETPQVLSNAGTRVLLDSYDDYGWVHEGSRNGKWLLASTTVLVAANRRLTPYLNVDRWDRLNIRDYTVNPGAYIKFDDGSYANAQIGFGGDARYLYRFMSQLEYKHKLSGAWAWHTGVRYLNYAFNDVYIVYPGLTYYFGNNEFSVYYNNAVTEGRGEASSGVLRGTFALTERFALYAGAAAGERLYDIFELPASEQFGYIAFAGFRIKINAWLSGRTGYSYSTEKPGFIKRSLEIGISAKF